MCPKFWNWFFRYWSHVVNCPSCNSAYKGLNALEVILQFASLAFIGIAGATKHNVYTMVAMAVVCFVGSKWLHQFIYKNFHYHDYDHAFRWGVLKICLHWWMHDPAINGWNGISSMQNSSALKCCYRICCGRWLRSCFSCEVIFKYYLETFIWNL